MYDRGSYVCIASDAMFADAIFGGKLDPDSDADFNLYNYETGQTKSAVGIVTGLISELKRKITEYELEKVIWIVHWALHLLCRKDPDPRKKTKQQ